MKGALCENTREKGFEGKHNHIEMPSEKSQSEIRLLIGLSAPC